MGGERRVYTYIGGRGVWREGEGVAEIKMVLMDGTLDKVMWPTLVLGDLQTD